MQSKSKSKSSLLEQLFFCLITYQLALREVAFCYILSYLYNTFLPRFFFFLLFFSSCISIIYINRLSLIERINKKRKGEMEIEENIYMYLLRNVFFFFCKKKRDRSQHFYDYYYLHSLTYVAPRGWGVGEERGGKRCLS